MNLHWYWVNRSNWSAIEAATRQDMGVFIISPNDKGGKLYEPSDKLRALCEPYSPMVFNDLFCLQRRSGILGVAPGKPVTSLPVEGGIFDDLLSPGGSIGHVLVCHPWKVKDE